MFVCVFVCVCLLCACVWYVCEVWGVCLVSVWRVFVCVSLCVCGECVCGV